MKHLLLPLCLVLPLPALAENLCDVTDPARLSGLAGDWRGDQAISLESLENSLMRAAPDDGITLTVDDAGAFVIGSEFFDSLLGAGLPMVLAEVRPYDVDRVDDVLDTTDQVAVADVLSDTRCGPEALPQLVAQIDAGEGGGVSVQGTVTLVAYFTDRMLQVTELELQSGEALIYMTATALLRPTAPQTQ